MKCETPRQAYIRILESQAKGLPVLEEKDLIYAAELVRGKYLKGKAPENEDGQHVSVGVTGITLEGRLFLLKLESDEKAESWIVALNVQLVRPRRHFRRSPYRAGKPRY